ncbi:hypothetical protein KEM55_006829 [Ascosphaera atra]|nr:hypothetical protein KEM55_006829 [Ascosphaera atra]
MARRPESQSRTSSSQSRRNQPSQQRRYSGGSQTCTHRCEESSNERMNEMAGTEFTHKAPGSGKIGGARCFDTDDEHDDGACEEEGENEGNQEEADEDDNEEVVEIEDSENE